MLTDRFWKKVQKTETCWLWTGAKQSQGYGNVRVKKVYWRAHRLAYEELVGPIPNGKQLDHLCRVKNCVNPAHLEPVTAKENTQRAFSLITHCPKGHPLVEGNLSLAHLRSGSRRCLTCHRETARMWNRSHLRVQAG